MPKVKLKTELKENNNFIYKNLYQYKELSRVLGRRIKDLINLIDLFDEKKNDKVHKKNDKKTPIFFLSYEEIKRSLKIREKGRIGEDIGLFCYFGLIRKLSDKEIPQYLLKKSEKYKREKKYIKRISYFSLPTYNENLLNIANNKAKDLLENGFRKESFSRKFILFNFGEEKANEIFPQYEEENYQGFSIKDLKEIENIEKYVLKEIEIKKYVKENILCKNKIQKKYWLLSKKTILGRNNLACVYLTNDLKKKLKIESEKGRPKIIILNKYCQ